MKTATAVKVESAFNKAEGVVAVTNLSIEVAVKSDCGIFVFSFFSFIQFTSKPLSVDQ